MKSFDITSFHFKIKSNFFEKESIEKALRNWHSRYISLKLFSCKVCGVSEKVLYTQFSAQMYLRNGLAISLKANNVKNIFSLLHEVYASVATFLSPINY